MNAQPQAQTATERPLGRWYERFKALLFIVFCFEIGIFLLVFPWLANWHQTSITVMVPWLAGVWDNPFFRGAISGLGLVNILISFAEVGRLRRI